ncbi:hypothetical protein [Paucibacter sp. DJ2R-2]|uniref:hypothetical protein n=1 Tax=Paucibacter sp. DJ2R-2 TaxID=2893558 RepID=UPI0021E3F085|nr:hypothetical protein [Paucibacter sp. DJ2R-2]MCV2419414.1 hypothetical protein [Paucibacter sp. DJ4R-1]MCV2437682.1 hypothetical protein [Paucibacter sp. DJ2R-2]
MKQELASSQTPARRPRITAAHWAILAGLLLLGLLFNKLLGRVDVTFESSAGQWADSEILYKGVDFELIERRFRAACPKTSASLVRTTAFNWYNPFAWPSWYTDPKWRVPYQAPRQTEAWGSGRAFSCPD